MTSRTPGPATEYGHSPVSSPLEQTWLPASSWACWASSAMAHSSCRFWSAPSYVARAVHSPRCPRGSRTCARRSWQGPAFSSRQADGQHGCEQAGGADRGHGRLAEGLARTPPAGSPHASVQEPGRLTSRCSSCRAPTHHLRKGSCRRRGRGGSGHCLRFDQSHQARWRGRYCPDPSQCRAFIVRVLAVVEDRFPAVASSMEDLNGPPPHQVGDRIASVRAIHAVLPSETVHVLAIEEAGRRGDLTVRCSVRLLRHLPHGPGA